MAATLSSYELRGALDAGGDSASREPAVHVSSTGSSVVFQLRLPPTAAHHHQAPPLARSKSLDSLEIRCTHIGGSRIF